MPHVSPKLVNDKILQQIYDIFFKTSAGTHVSRKVKEKFFSELLTKTEKIMLAKRLVAIIMLSKGISPYRVGLLLKLSPTTTAKILQKTDTGSCKNIVSVWESERKSPLYRYLEGWLRPLPKYGTSPATWVKKQLKE